MEAEEAKEALRDQLRTAKSDAEAAKKDAETAKATALAEIAEQHRAEIAKLQARISELTDQLIAYKKAGKYNKSLYKNQVVSKLNPNAQLCILTKSSVFFRGIIYHHPLTKT